MRNVLIRLLMLLIASAIFGGCIGSPPSSTGSPDVGVDTGRGFELEEPDQGPDARDAVVAPDLDGVDAAPSSDTSTSDTSDSGGVACDQWEVQWSESTIDLESLNETLTQDRHLAVASREEVFIVGGTGNNQENPVPYARIFESVDGLPMESIFEAERKQLHHAQCVDGTCWFGGGSGQFGAIRDGAPEFYEVDGAPSGFTAWVVGAFPGIGMGFSDKGLILPGETEGVPFIYRPHEGNVSTTTAACNSRECFAPAAAKIDVGVFDNLHILHFDPSNLGVSQYAGTGLPPCTSERCGVGVVGASEVAWFIGLRSGPLLRSKDSGHTWAPLGNVLGGTTNQWGELEFHGNSGAVVADNALYMTINGGDDWKIISPHEPVHEISMLDEVSGAVIGDSAVRWFDIVCNDGP